MDRVALSIGSINIYWYSIFILIGVLIGSLIVYLEAKKQKLDKEQLVNLVFYTLIFAFIGARLYYVIFNLDYYSSHVIEILYIWNGGLAIHGGIVAACIFIFYYTKKNHINTLKLLDILVLGLIIGQVIGRWGNFFNGEAYGPIVAEEFLKNQYLPSFIIDGMYINGNYHMPTFLYESLWNLIGFFLLLLIRKFAKIKTGQLTGFYLMWYSVIRFIIEGFRTDSLMLGPLKMAQIVSIILFCIGLYLFFIKKKRKLYREEDIYEKV